jgi:hypothetical protein
VLDYTNLGSFPRENSAGGYVFGFSYAIGVVFVVFLAVDARKSNTHRWGMVIAAVIAVLGLIYFGLRSRANSDLDGFISGAGMGLILGTVGCLPCAMISLI